MRINVLCVYWFLLCVSFFSSCLLFILVASESDKFGNTPEPPNLKDETAQINITDVSGGSAPPAPPAGDPEPPLSEGANLRSSFNDPSPEKIDSEPNSDVYGFADHLSKNSGISEGYSDTNGVIFTLVDTASAELQQKATEILEPSTTEEKNTTSTLILEVETNKTELEIEEAQKTKEVRSEEQIVINETAQEKTNSTEDVHEIPSFSEWTQKQLEEAEKKKEKGGNASSNNQNTVKSVNNLKLRSKNYASPDCGAKIVAANPEAVSAGSVLSPSRDEYKLNTCTSRIWFIVELCEAIQAKKIDLANFELFSSSPKDFSVSVSDRFPSREWSSVGQFTAKDERDVQSFNLHPHMFGKFIKVEMLSHYGSEHFCPISLFRVYGTSEFEVLETEDQAPNLNDDDDDDETLDSYKGEPSNNLFGSARDAVMSIVKKAAEVLVKGSDLNQTIKNQLNSTKYTPLINSCTTPSRIIVCDNCSELMFGNVYELLSCDSSNLDNLVKITAISHLLYNTDLCLRYGLNFLTKSNDLVSEKICGYLSSFFAPKYQAALCNMLAVIENKVVWNVSNTFTNDSNASANITDINQPEDKTILETLCPKNTPTEVKTCAGSTETIQDPSETLPESKTPEILEIKPTRTIVKDEQILNSSPDLTEAVIDPTSKENLEPSENSVLMPSSVQKNVTEELRTLETATVLPEDISESDEIVEPFDPSLFDPEDTIPTTVAPPSANHLPGQKESYILRLSTRIKALERNMSLSGQYLEELSRRYKKQVEEMQKAFEKKLTIVNEEMKRRDDRELKMQEQLSQLSESLNTLLSERDGIWKTASLISQVLFMEIFVACIVVYFCWRSDDKVIEDSKVKTVIKKRRQSIDTIGHETPVIKKSRRPSEEALKITGTYEDLLIPENDLNWPLTKAEKRRRRKKNALLRTQSIIEQKHHHDLLKRSSSFEVSNIVRKQSAPAQMYVNGDVSPPVRLQELPFALEEPDHSTVEPLEVYVEKPAPNVRLGVKNGSVKSAILKSSPIFMKTALSSRSKRNSAKLSLFKSNGKTQGSSNEESSQRRSPDLSIASNNISESTDDRSSVGSLNMEKKKKMGGFRKIFKKVFE